MSSALNSISTSAAPILTPTSTSDSQPALGNPRQLAVEAAADKEAASEAAAAQRARAKLKAHQDAGSAADSLVRNVALGMGADPRTVALNTAFPTDPKYIAAKGIAGALTSDGDPGPPATPTRGFWPGTQLDNAASDAAKAVADRHRAVVNAHIDDAYRRAAMPPVSPSTDSNTPSTSPPTTNPPTGLPVSTAQDLQTNP